MKEFRFNLERVLRLRRYREREREIELAEVTGRCLQLREAIDGCLRAKAFALHGRYAYGTGFDVLAASHLYVARLEQQISRHESALRAEEIKRAEAQERFLEAQRERKVLDKLKERESAAYAKEQRLQEVAEIDDINTGRSAMQRSAMRRSAMRWSETEQSGMQRSNVGQTASDSFAPRVQEKRQTGGGEDGG